VTNVPLLFFRFFANLWGQVRCWTKPTAAVAYLGVAAIQDAGGCCWPRTKLPPCSTGGATRPA